jgi:hypothetical protein
MESLLAELTDYAAVACWPQPEFTCKQASSYDRGTVAPDKPGWFANNDQNQFIRTEDNQGRKERVMLDADGPGCIVRFWLSTKRNKKGTLRIYLDGATEPALAFPTYDLLSGDLKIGAPLVQPHPGYRPDGNGGNNFYLPIPYAKHCKITWEEASDVAPRKLVLYATQAPDYATLRFQVNGQGVTTVFDGYAAGVQPAAAFVLGVFAPRQRKFTLWAEVAGANAKSGGARYYFGLDCVVLVKP